MNIRRIISSSIQGPSFHSARIAIRQSPQFVIRVLPILAQLSLILIWAMWAGRAYLDFNPSVWPVGKEYALSVRENYFWRNLLRCGTCALWNGSMDGGYPALVDLQGAPLHPIFAIPTLLFGIVNGSKVAIVLGLALMGFSQWWLGRLLDIGWAARLWAALLAVVAGSITGRMESGLTTLVVSTACAALVIPAALNLWQRPNARSTVLLAISLTSLLLSGQGYMQIAVGLGLFPALGVLCVGSRENRRPFLTHFFQSGLIAILLSAIFLVPIIHHGGRMVKDVDPVLGNVQPLEYLPVNLIVRDPAYFYNDALQKTPFPVLFTNYIGWVPILLAVLAFRFVPREQNRLLTFFVAAIGLIFLTASMVIPKFLFHTIAEDFLLGIRHPSLMAGLAAPCILALSAWGLDYALKAGPQVNLIWNRGESTPIRLSVILLIIPLAWGLLSAFNFSKEWLFTIDMPADVNLVMDAAKTDSAQWVEFPMGEMYWSIYAFDRDIKLSPTFHPWHFRDYSFPPTSLIADRIEALPEIENVIYKQYGMVIAHNGESEYASVKTTAGVVSPCRAIATGGNIDITCETMDPGKLVINEHAWAGWTARIDNHPARLLPGEWLAVDLPAGKHRITLRYLPWDVPIGLFISLSAIGLAFRMWIKKN